MFESPCPFEAFIVASVTSVEPLIVVIFQVCNKIYFHYLVKKIVQILSLLYFVESSYINLTFEYSKDSSFRSEKV